MILGAFAVIFPILKLFPGYRHMRSIVLITDAYTEFQEVEQQLTQVLTCKELQALIDQLNGLEAENTEDWISSIEMRTLFSMKGTLDNLRSKIVDKINELGVIVEQETLT